MDNIHIIIGIIVAFLVGCLYTRIYYARITARTDWMRSWDWSDNKYYKMIHRFICETCPKRHYCDRYKMIKFTESFKKAEEDD